MSSGESECVLPFPSKPTEFSAEEKPHRVRAEAERLSRLSEVDWRFQLKERAKHFDVEEAVLREMVVALVRDREKQAKKEKAEDQRREKQRLADQKRADEEVRRRHRQKEKEFSKLNKLPRSEQDARLAELARHLGEDPAALRDEFEEFTGGGVTLGDLPTPATPTTWNVVPWDEPVDVALLFQELDDQISKYIALVKERRFAVVLWVTMSWIHNEVATHSPLLDVVSVDEASGKTELMGVLGLLTPKPCLGAEFTAANIYRTVDADKPTLIIDEVDDVFQRKPDLKHIVNNSWTRGFKIPRQVRMGGEIQTYWFDPFCPKVLGHLLMAGKPLPRTLASRGIQIKIWPKRPDEKVKEFLHRDDDELATLRRKLLRFANDQTKAIAEIKPTFPAGFNNRVRANWKLLLAIAELAAGDWPERARKAAEFIAGKTEGSQGARLFRAFHAMCVGRLKGGATEIVIPSEEAVSFLKDFDPYWGTDYRGSDGHPGEITQHKLAALLRNYEIGSQTIHPTKQAGVTRGGYRIFERGTWNARWIDMFARYCPGLSNIQTLTRPDRPDGRKLK
jgi:hypothetical protein